MEPTNQNPTSSAPKKGITPIIIVVLLIILAALTAGVIYWSDRSDNKTQPTISNQAQSANLQAQISGETDAANIKADQEISVSLYVDSGDEPVNAVGAVFTYPEDSLEFQSIDSTTGTFPTVAKSQGGAGNVRVEAGVAPGSDGVTGKQLIAVVKFKAKNGSGQKELAFVDGTAVISSKTYENVLGGTQNVKLTFEAN